MKRVAVVGSGGAGKSTFARRLGEATGLPVVHLDRLFWKPGWVETPSDEWRAVQADLVEQEQWIVDGNYGGTLDVRLRAADTVVWFDLPRLVCVRRAFWRSLRNHGRSIQADGCPERFDLEFYRWIWNYPNASRVRVVAAVDAHAGDATVVVMKHARDATRFLDEIAPKRGDAAGVTAGRHALVK